MWNSRPNLFARQPRSLLTPVVPFSLSRRPLDALARLLQYRAFQGKRGQAFIAANRFTRAPSIHPCSSYEVAAPAAHASVGVLPIRQPD
jgi:hypothetical protein